MYERILVAADGSENSIRAAKEAIKLASVSPNSHVTIVYVTDFEKTKSDVLHANSSESLYVARRQKVAPIEQLLFEANISFTTEILRGAPGPEIVKYANEHPIDLVIIGSRGLNSLQEMVLGSVSHKVMKRVQCPALIVK